MADTKGKIIYALIAKGVVPLVGYSNFTGTFDQACIKYLQNVKPNSSAAVKLDSDYIFYYLNESNITYLLMTDNLYPKEAALGCLESIKKEFQSSYNENDIDTSSQFALNNGFQTKLRMKFDYFNANTDVSNEAIGRLKDEMSKMKDEVLNASGLIDERGGKVKALGDKSDNLSRDSNSFYRASKRVKRAEMMKRIKLYATIGCVILLIIYIITCFVCGSLVFNCS